jgi:hypothetical protein
MAMRVYLNYIEKLEELQHARQTLPLMAQPVATSEGSKLTNAKPASASIPEEAANQNDLKSG